MIYFIQNTGDQACATFKVEKKVHHVIAFICRYFVDRFFGARYMGMRNAHVVLCIGGQSSN